MAKATAAVLLAIILMVSVSGFCGRAQAAGTVADPELYGTWEVTRQNVAGMTVQVTFEIEEGLMTSHSTCSFKEFSVLAEVSSPAVITADRIEILESKRVSKEHSPGFLKCQASIRAQSIPYELKEGKLFLLNPETKEPFALQRLP